MQISNCRFQIGVAALVMSYGTGLAQERPLPPFEYDRWARFVVRQVFDAQPHEKYVLLGDPSYYPEFIDALRAEFLEARAVEVGTILFDGRRAAERRRGARPRETGPEYQRLSDAAMRRLFQDADIFLWLPYRYGTGDERGDRRLIEHLTEDSHARGLHFHWVWGGRGLASYGSSTVDSLSAINARALYFTDATIVAGGITLVQKGELVK